MLIYLYSVFWRIQLMTSSEFSKNQIKRFSRSYWACSHLASSSSWLKHWVIHTWMTRSTLLLATTSMFLWRDLDSLTKQWCPSKWRQWVLRREPNKNWSRRTVRNTRPRWRQKLSSRGNSRRTQWRTERSSKPRKIMIQRVTTSSSVLTWSNLSHHLSREKDDELRELNRNVLPVLCLSLVEWHYSSRNCFALDLPTLSINSRLAINWTRKFYSFNHEPLKQLAGQRCFIRMKLNK